MTTWSFYDTTTGLFTGTAISGIMEQTAIDNTPTGCAYVEGAYDELSQKVDLSDPPTVIDYIPDSPGDDYEWIDYDGDGNRVMRWQLTADAVESQEIIGAAQNEIARLSALTFDPMRKWVVSMGPLPEDPVEEAAVLAHRQAMWEQVVDLSGQVDAQQAIIDAAS